MSLFYFNFRQGASYSLDDVGCEFDSVEEAYLGAVTATQDLWRELMVRREDPLACAFEVVDRDGNELFTLPFSEVLEACNGHASGSSFPPSAESISSALAHHRSAKKAMSDVTTALKETRTTLRDTLELLSQVGRATSG